jgi:hypothetical protein
MIMSTDNAQSEKVKMYPIKLSKREKKSNRLVAQYKRKIGVIGPKPKRDDAVKSEKEKRQDERAKINAKKKHAKLNPTPLKKKEKIVSAAEAKEKSRVPWKKGNHVVVNESLSRFFNNDGEIKNNMAVEGTVDKTQPMPGDTGVVLQVKNQTFVTVDFSLSDLKYDKEKKTWQEVRKEDKDQQKDIWDMHYSTLTLDPNAPAKAE